MFGNDRTGMRRVFTEAWRKQQQGEAMDPLETLIADIVRQHPEYHELLQDPERALERDFSPDGGETNPFLHLGMHISLQEQVGTDRPAGITLLYRRLVMKTGDPHQAEHRMMECLGRMLWEAQRAGRMPDEAAYLACVRRLVEG
ncbi:MAG TPA: DUF1841 family protein [Sedimenticola thiotaurini]|uniref:DUF1841 family protein n=1 Tax=Sedimenticola thiotaurini TaxID=1543721 RepID=A0A831WAI1_9GAMM|nr:DUF1841 family protein [Sedimenticola thiotaurini]